MRFAQPVLDTLLLSAVLHPDLESHGLEAIAERMGIRQMGRHTALGDAIMTGEIFLRMIPLLAEQGIRTLGAGARGGPEDLLRAHRVLTVTAGTRRMCTWAPGGGGARIRRTRPPGRRESAAHHARCQCTGRS